MFIFFVERCNSNIYFDQSDMFNSLIVRASHTRSLKYEIFPSHEATRQLSLGGRQRVTSLRATYAVVSCPPPCDPVLKKIPAGFPASFCICHRLPVASKNALNCDGIIPNRVGNPKMSPSASVSSSGVMIGASVFGGALIFSRISSGNVSGTYWKTSTRYSDHKMLPVRWPEV